jgi:hypothetical protein
LTRNEIAGLAAALISQPAGSSTGGAVRGPTSMTCSEPSPTGMT